MLEVGERVKTSHLSLPALSTLLCSLLAFPACSGTEGYAPGVPGSDKADDTTSTGAPLMASSYALDLESRTTTRDRTTGAQSEVVTEATLVATVHQDGDTVTMEIEMCSLTPPELSGHRPTIKQSLVDSLPLYNASGSITAGTLNIDDLNILVGVNGNQAPVDQDHDGNPGVTIQVDSQIGVIDIYGSATLNATFDAQLANVDRIEGNTDIAMDLAVYGDNSFFVDVASMAAEAKANSEVLAEENHLVMTALEPGSSCANQMRPPLPLPVDGCVSGTGEVGDCCDAGGGPESGQCIDIFANSCSTDVVPSMCPSGAANVKCCPR